MDVGTQRVFWHGRHAVLPFCSPLGKLHRDGLRVLTDLGWTSVDRGSSDSRVPAFAWTTRRAADWPSAGARLPLVRPLPQALTDCLDDKVRCADLLNAAGATAGWVPETHTDLAALAESLGGRSDDERLWFVKHRHGVKGRAVRPLRTHGLLEWLQKHLSQPPRQRSGGGDFVVQREVSPPALLPDGRKFALRAHVLVACGASRAPPAAWLHRDVIALPHAACVRREGSGEAPGEAEEAPSAAAAGRAHEEEEKAAHVSSAGRHHPPPLLLHELPPAAVPDEARLRAALRDLVGRSLSAARASLVPPDAQRCERSTLYALMGYDVALDAAGRPMLLEVNSHPAIGDGTMAAVDKGVYTRLVTDVVRLIVLPALRREEGRPAGELVHEHAEAMAEADEREDGGGFERLVPDASWAHAPRTP